MQWKVRKLGHPAPLYRHLRLVVFNDYSVSSYNKGRKGHAGFEFGPAIRMPVAANVAI